MDWIVRAGVAGVSSLIRGYQLHLGVPGFYGFSVQYAPGKTMEELALARRFPHPAISSATSSALMAALQPLGSTMRLVKSPGQGYHHTFTVLYDASGAILRTLPQDAAVALSSTFRKRPNPYRVPYPWQAREV